MEWVGRGNALERVPPWTGVSCSEGKREGPTNPGLQGCPRKVSVVKHLLTAGQIWKDRQLQSHWADKERGLRRQKTHSPPTGDVYIIRVYQEWEGSHCVYSFFMEQTYFISSVVVPIDPAHLLNA